MTTAAWTHVLAAWSGPFEPTDEQLARIYARFAYIADRDATGDVTYLPLRVNAADFSWSVRCFEADK